MGEGLVRDAERRAQADRRGATPPPGSARSQLAEKEGLALINGTDGMLGMLVLAITDLRRLLKVADITRRDERGGPARHRRRLRRRTCNGCGPIPASARRPPTCGR